VSAAGIARAIIADLDHYAVWANERLLACAERLGEAPLRHRFTQGALPILDNLVHLVSSDRRWLARWQEAPLPPGLTAADLPGVAAVRQAWRDLASRRAAYLALLDDAALGAVIRWPDADGARALLRWQAIVQCANHGTQHRSEIAAMLTDCGQSPGDLDFGLWCRTAADRAPAT